MIRTLRAKTIYCISLFSSQPLFRALNIYSKADILESDKTNNTMSEWEQRTVPSIASADWRSTGQSNRKPWYSKKPVDNGIVFIRGRAETGEHCVAKSLRACGVAALVLLPPKVERPTTEHSPAGTLNMGDSEDTRLKLRVRQQAEF